MGKQSDEIERLERLRERQLKARDPLAKQRRIERKVTARRRKLKKQESLLSILTDVPRKWQGVVIGALAGMLISIVLTMAVEATWAEYAGLGAVLFLVLVGYSIGQGLDARDELRELMDE